MLPFSGKALQRLPIAIRIQCTIFIKATMPYSIFLCPCIMSPLFLNQNPCTCWFFCSKFSSQDYCLFIIQCQMKPRLLREAYPNYPCMNSQATAFPVLQSYPHTFTLFCFLYGIYLVYLFNWLLSSTPPCHTHTYT